LIVGASKAKTLWMGTFHSIFARILRSEADYLGYSSNFSIYDTQDSERLISSIIKELKLDKDLYKYRNIRNRISSLKNNLVTVKAYYNNQELIQQDKESRRPMFGKIYQTYVNRCFKASAMDFDDLLLKTNELLNRFPEVLNKYQQRFKYIHVDEYQDTNHSQYLIVKALADKFENICVVGDDAQSIYGFRGANIENILSFQKDYPNSSVYRLEQNYRSTQNIVNAANSVINNNLNKLDKKVWTENEIGEKIEINQTITDSEEGRFVASSIFEAKYNQQLRNDEFAVLYRTNAQSRSIEDALRRKNINPPHVLVMTATPIPRTLAMTVYGDLDISIIDELPPGRKIVKTVHRSDSNRLEIFRFLKDEIRKGRQVYIVYPLIEESKTMDYKDLMDGYESISREFPNKEYQLSILHGRMKSEDKAFEMKRFKDGKTNIMVSTTVIEVGVNIPNASVMVIESSEKFGLSQLHQLRGRVGRGSENSYCILMTSDKLSSDARKRIKTMTSTNDGFKVAEVDMEIRGPGNLLGTQQSGLLNLKIANIITDKEILESARHDAEKIISSDQKLIKIENKLIKEEYNKKTKNTLLWKHIS
ncbi:UvrD-helicase domain-containing protein, partial [Flavobacteriaceae bacterium]|nr:UvrD-helicase domain-containing protein [Flavobacteriaceae bacterium]